MNAMIHIILILIGICLSYPFFLLVFSGKKVKEDSPANEPQSVSVILFSFNNIKYLDQKVQSLMSEMRVFKNYELIIIDNRSCDGSKEVLDNYAGNKNIKVLHNDKCKSVASTINIGVREARYEFIIFSDLRQNLCRNALREIVMPLRNKEIGAVSSCLSAIDKNGNVSVTRTIENKIKRMESRSGNLIGVYGPLYAIRKDCFRPIPDHIVLEDLYLSLSILQSHKIALKENCLIFDENFSDVYNFKRAIRYSRGLAQLFGETKLISGLSILQIIMLLWHKYLRLLIPVLGFSLLIVLSIAYNFLLVFVSTILFLSAVLLIPSVSSLQAKLKEITLINLYYLGAFFNSLLYPFGKAYRYVILAAGHFWASLGI